MVSVAEALAAVQRAKARAEAARARAETRENFYTCPQWRRLRYRVLAASDGRCQCCGARGGSGVVLHVDHIEPISKNPARKLDATNLQVLCESCNLGKGASDQIDWREPGTDGAPKLRLVR